MIHHLSERWHRPVSKAHHSPHHGPITSLAAIRVLSALLTVLGVACIFFTHQIHAIFPYLLGSLMVITGLLDIYRGIVAKEYLDRDTKQIAGGIVMLLLGLVILLHQGNTDSIIGGVWGAIGLFKGSEELNMAIYHRAHKEPFIKAAIHAAVELVLAMILLLDPLTAVAHHVFILGFELIWHSLEIFHASMHLEQ